jgi:hypothetical protein
MRRAVGAGDKEGRGGGAGGRVNVQVVPVPEAQEG